MRDERQYLADIAEAAEVISRHVANVTFDEFVADQTLQQAVLFCFTIIGEAAGKISQETKSKYPDIEWSSIISFRNIIVHAYFSLNLKTVWTAATRKVSPFADHVRAILRHESRGDDSDSTD